MTEKEALRQLVEDDLKIMENVEENQENGRAHQRKTSRNRNIAR